MAISAPFESSLCRKSFALIARMVAIDETARSGGVEHGRARGHQVDGTQNLGGVGILEQKPIGPGG
ncbi:hypothetical protein [Nocardia vinacea]|uniref:hypothetical protein n=1 Tax=Nocardia vinacea TaxID=96468 RepID=UPI001C3F1845|nr:hypothetical protein [Nocardia vinacea]